jgi:malate synthase
MTSAQGLTLGVEAPSELEIRPGRAELDASAAQSVLSTAACAFVAQLERRFGARRRALIERRQRVQRELDAGWRFEFPAETRELRAAPWKIAPLPPDLLRRQVEITGPTDPKMVINALNSGADVFMADFEDSLSPTWKNVVEGQATLMAAVRRTLTHVAPETGKRYALNERTAVLLARPRGWHLEEKHAWVGDRPVSASLFDAGLYLFHNARELVARGSGPYLYLPKLESHLEARLWHEVFLAVEDALELPRGTIRATVLIETLPAAFEMDEILWELGEHAAGLNCGRWDYIFSFIKRLRADPCCVLPDRASVTMEAHFLRSYSLRLIQVCHRRGASAMGGMAAQIPIKDDADRNAAALAKVRADKRREAADGHDGTWVAHPGLVSVARAELARVLAGPHQIHRLRTDVEVGAADLLRVPEGELSEHGLRHNVAVGIEYLAAWLSGSGCVPLYDLMEDAATAEISRTQIWQALRHGARLADGRRVDRALVERLAREELERVAERAERAERHGREHFERGAAPLAHQIFARLSTAAELSEFLTLEAYSHLD